MDPEQRTEGLERWNQLTYDETVSGLDPSPAKDNFTRRDAKATRLSNEAKVFEGVEGGKDHREAEDRFEYEPWTAEELGYQGSQCG